MDSERGITSLMCVGNPGLPSTPACILRPAKPSRTGLQAGTARAALGFRHLLSWQAAPCEGRGGPCQRPREGARSWRKSCRAEVRGGACGGKLRTGKTQKGQRRQGQSEGIQTTRRFLAPVNDVWLSHGLLSYFVPD